MKLSSKLAEFLYPVNAVCAGCGDLAGADHDGLCDDCEARLEKQRVRSMEGRCPLCMSPLTPGICEGCRLMAGWIGRAAYAFDYSDPAAHIVRHFKYRGAGNFAGWMAEQMLKSPAARDIIARCDVIVFAPADRFRKSRRGYNQAQLLAKEISIRTGLPLMEALARRPFVRKQAKLDRERRLDNLTGVIRCNMDLSGRRVLLVDDVRTTGATAVACAKALKAAGAEMVELMTYAGVE